MSKVVVLGSGMQGTACAYDLAFNPSITEVVIADIELNKAQESVQKINHPKVVAKQIDVKNQTALIDFLKPFDVLISAVPYFFNFNITQAAIASKTHMVDMGGNTDLVFKQRTLTQEAQTAGVTILPDAGLAPGMANILAVHAINQLENVNTVQIRVGGLPKFPKPPLNYQLFFSVHGLINEYMGRSVVLKNGKIEEVETLTEVESIHFRDPIGNCEAFHT
ncbi:MAG: saccharopine dehydrogenase NADP-binding domain-containing protein, partial [Cyanobacteria bacterium]|nr:saccharopine dehydrogenase NADP-binding domain-containing protein [Cyanobacteriota bacterium]